MRFSSRITLIIIGISLLSFGVVQAQDKAAPASISSALIIKLAAFEKKLSAGGDISVYVMGAPDVAAEFKKVIGTKIGGAVLKQVTEGNSLPTAKPTIYYIGGAAMLAEALTYTKNNKVLSVSGKPDLAAKGVTLSIAVGGDGKPKVLLNLTSSANEGCDWNPAIMKVAKTIK